MELKPVKCFIIGIGERSCIVNRTLYGNRDAEDIGNKEFLNLDYIRQQGSAGTDTIDDADRFFSRAILYDLKSLFAESAENANIESAVKPNSTSNKETENRVRDIVAGINKINALTDAKIPDLISEQLRILCKGSSEPPAESRLKEVFGEHRLYAWNFFCNLAEKTDLKNTVQPEFRFSTVEYEILRQRIGRVIESLSKYDSESRERNLRIIVHTYLNADYYLGLDMAQQHAREAPAERPTETHYHFSRNMFFVVLDIIRYFAEEREINLDVFPVFMFRTNLEKFILQKKDRLLGSFLGYLALFRQNIDTRSWLLNTFLIQDFNNWNDAWTLHEQVTLLYLTILVLGEIGSLTKKLNLDSNIYYRNNILGSIPGDKDHFRGRHRISQILSKLKIDASDIRLDQQARSIIEKLEFFEELYTEPTFTAIGVITNTFPFKTIKKRLHEALLHEALVQVSTSESTDQEDPLHRPMPDHEKEVLRNYLTNGMSKRSILLSKLVKHIEVEDFLVEYLEDLFRGLAQAENHELQDFLQQYFSDEQKRNIIGKHLSAEKDQFAKENIIKGESFYTLKKKVTDEAVKTDDYKDRALRLDKIISETIAYYEEYPIFFRKHFLEGKLYDLQRRCLAQNRSRMEKLYTFCTGFSSLQLFRDPTQKIQREFAELAQELKAISVDFAPDGQTGGSANETLYDVIVKRKDGRSNWQVLKAIIEQARKVLEVSFIPTLKRKYQDVLADARSRSPWRTKHDIESKTRPVIQKIARLPSKAGRLLFILLVYLGLGVAISPKLLSNVHFFPKDYLFRSYEALITGSFGQWYIELDKNRLSVWDLVYWGVILALAILTHRIINVYYERKYRKLVEELRNFIETELEKPAHAAYSEIRMQNIFKNILRFFNQYRAALIKINRYFLEIENTLSKTKSRLRNLDAGHKLAESDGKIDYTELNREFFEGLRLHNEQEENKVFVNLVSESISAIFKRNRFELQRKNSPEVQEILRALMAEHETYSRSPEEIIQSLTNNLHLFDNIIEREFDALKKNTNAPHFRGIDFKKFIPLRLSNLTIKESIRSQIRYEDIDNESDNHFLQMFFTENKFSLSDLITAFLSDTIPDKAGEAE